MQALTSTVSADSRQSGTPVATRWQASTPAPASAAQAAGHAATVSDVDRAFLAFRRGVELVAYTGAAAEAMRANLLQLLADLDSAQVRAARLGQPAARSAQQVAAVKPERRQKYLTPEQLVQRWDGAVVAGTLANWRSKSTPEKPLGPTFQKFGTNVRYPIADVEEYERTHAVGPSRKDGAEAARGWAGAAH